MIVPKPGEELSTRQQQELMLDIMKSIHKFFETNGLRYTMIYGTLLGAVRHQGFIPWDNDMDIGVPRPDYDKMLALLDNGKCIGTHLYHLHYGNDDNYHYQITRICDDRTIVKPPYIRDTPKRMGLWVDIFPIDGVPAMSPIGILRRSRLFINKKIQIADIYALRSGRTDIGNRIGNLVCAIFPNPKKRNQTIDAILRKTPFESSAMVADMEDRDEHYAIMTRDDFDQAVLMNFESEKFYAPKNWQKYLEDYYGDYMTLPPEKDRMVHTNKCRWI